MQQKVLELKLAHLPLYSDVDAGLHPDAELDAQIALLMTETLPPRISLDDDDLTATLAPASGLFTSFFTE
ncbi:MAG: hypothetical protein G8237_05260 [Magnetococcales bacterium]|nr:hypothetical protein [Magnetococcales bacterium]